MTKNGVLAFIAGIIYTFVLGFAMFYLGTQFPTTKSTFAQSNSTIPTNADYTTPIPYDTYAPDSTVPEDTPASTDDVFAGDNIKYTVKEYNGAIGVFKGTELIKIVDVNVDDLRQSDQDALKAGIVLNTQEDVAALLEDYGS